MSVTELQCFTNKLFALTIFSEYQNLSVGVKMAWVKQIDQHIS
jgi:hypothetical protein